MTNRRQFALFLLALMLADSVLAADATLLLEEKFEDASFAARGWYDGSGPPLSSVEHIPGSVKSAEYRWRQGATIPTGTGPFRRKFTPSEAVYVSYWVKYSTNYTGSNRPYHPHEFLLLTTKNVDYAGPAYTHLTGYIEQNEGKPMIGLQDGQNVDESRIGQDLTSVTENRSVAGCNGTLADGHTHLDCYTVGANHWNGKMWRTADVKIKNGEWQRVEAYFKLNSIANGKGVPDGQLRYWLDGKLLIESTNVILRTGANADMKWNQFMIAPYIGDGSPVDQAMWVDDLRITTTRLVADVDGDKMPDDWEVEHELDARNPADASEDADGDGFVNLAEYLAGTNPRDPGSYLHISEVTVDGGNCTIRFGTEAGKRYHVERTNDLGAGGWLAVASNIVGTGSIVEIVDAGESARFYRLKLG